MSFFNNFFQKKKKLWHVSGSLQAIPERFLCLGVAEQPAHQEGAHGRHLYFGCLRSLICTICRSNHLMHLKHKEFVSIQYNFIFKYMQYDSHLDLFRRAGFKKELIICIFSYICTLYASGTYKMIFYHSVSFHI